MNCNLCGKYVLPDAVFHHCDHGLEIERLRVELSLTRNAVRLCISRSNGTPWHLVPDADVDVVVEFVRAYPHKAQGEGG